MDRHIECEHHDGDQNKRKRPKISEKANKMTRLTDVNEDCLTHIFQYLRLLDLMNVADTSTQFQIPVRRVFINALYEVKQISLLPESKIRKKLSISFEVDIRIYDVISCLKYYVSSAG